MPGPRLASALSRSGRVHAEHIALECDGRSLTFAEVESNSNRVANFLLEKATSPNDRVAMILPNRIEFPEIEFGIAKSGLIAVEISPNLSTAALLGILQDADARIVIVDATLIDVLAAIRSECAATTFVAVGLSAGPAWATPYEEVLRATSSAEPPLPADPNRLHRLAYTSGTTGEPKGVELSETAVLAVAYNLLLEFGPVPPGHRLLHLQPLCHGTGMFVLPWYLRGGTSVIHSRFDAEAAVQARVRDHVNAIKLVPTMLVSMLELGADQMIALRGIESIIYGASPMPVERLRAGIDLLGAVFAQLYGQSESPMTITVLPKQDHILDGSIPLKRLSSAGRSWTNVDVRVVGEDGSELGVGEVGEVAVLGPQNMSGYWNRPSATAETLVDGWVRTRDMGMMDEEGYLYLLDRKHDMIITGGLNVYPREIEEVLYQHPGVLDAIVVGIHDGHWGERVVAAVAPRPGTSVTEADLLEICREHLTRYKIPKEVVFLDSMPKTPFGKVSRREIRDLLTANGKA